MDKKQLLIAMLEKLWEQWLPANWLLILIQEHPITPQTIEWLYQVLQQALLQASDQATKAHLQKWIDYMQRLMEAEQKDKQQDATDLEALEALIHTF